MCWSAAAPGRCSADCCAAERCAPEWCAPERCAPQLHRPGDGAADDAAGEEAAAEEGALEGTVAVHPAPAEAARLPRRPEPGEPPAVLSESPAGQVGLHPAETLPGEQ